MRDLMFAVDFGTSNSLLAAVDANTNYGLATLDADAADPHVLRSLIYFESQSAQHFGERAISQFTDNSMQGRFLKSFKRFLPMKSFEGTQIDGRFWKLEDLVARFLRELRERGNRHFACDATRLLLGRPALFSEDLALDQLAQDRLRRAAELAGFKSIDFLPEPVAAAYRFRLEMKREEVVLVADFGGGTSDYTILKLSPKTFVPDDVLAIGGAPVAGDLLDGSIMQYLVGRNFGSEVRYQVGMGRNVLQMPKALMAHLCSTAYINLLNGKENRAFLNQVKSWALGPEDSRHMAQLEILLENQLGFAVFEAIEAGKKSLSGAGRSEIRYEYPGVKVREKLSRKEFDSFTESPVAKIFGALDETLAKAQLKATDIDRVCCTGGTARVGIIRQGLVDRFGEARLENFRNFTSIVEGLSERARQLF